VWKGNNFYPCHVSCFCCFVNKKNLPEEFALVDQVFVAIVQFSLAPFDVEPDLTLICFFAVKRVEYVAEALFFAHDKIPFVVSGPVGGVGGASAV
jgi:hypothetical protein